MPEMLLWMAVISISGALWALSCSTCGKRVHSIRKAGLLSDRIGWMLERTPAFYASALFLRQSTAMASRNLSTFRLSNHLILSSDIPCVAGVLMLFLRHNLSEPDPSFCI